MHMKYIFHFSNQYVLINNIDEALYFVNLVKNQLKFPLTGVSHKKIHTLFNAPEKEIKRERTIYADKLMRLHCNGELNAITISIADGKNFEEIQRNYNEAQKKFVDKKTKDAHIRKFDCDDRIIALSFTFPDGTKTKFRGLQKKRKDNIVACFEFVKARYDKYSSVTIFETGIITKSQGEDNQIHIYGPYWFEKYKYKPITLLKINDIIEGNGK